MTECKKFLYKLIGAMTQPKKSIMFKAIVFVMGEKKQ